MTRYKVSTHGDRWRYFATVEDAIGYEARLRARDGAFRAVVAYRARGERMPGRPVRTARDEHAMRLARRAGAFLRENAR